MLSIQFIREHADVVRKSFADRQTPGPLDEILALDEWHRSAARLDSRDERTKDRSR